MHIKKAKILVSFLLILLSANIFYSIDFGILPKSVENGFINKGVSIRLVFQPCPDPEIVRNYIIIIEKNGLKLVTETVLDTLNGTIWIKVPDLLDTGNNFKLIVKKLAGNSGTYGLIDLYIKDIVIRKSNGEISNQTTKLSREQLNRIGKKNSISVVQAEDIISISVWEHPDLSMKNRVDTNGDINYPLVGKIKVAGLTVSEIANLISKKLGNFLKEVYVIVEIVQKSIKEFRISVIGNIPKAGTHVFDHRPSIIELLSELGATGVTQKSGNSWEKINLKIIHSTHQVYKSAREILDNVPVYREYMLDNNTVVICSISEAEKVYILGNVKTPGEYDFKKGMRVFDALIASGGANGQSYQFASSQDYFRANLKQVMLIRKDSIKKEVSIRVVNMHDVIYKGLAKDNVPLQPDDCIVVPQKRVKNIHTYVSRLSPILNFIQTTDSVIKIFQ